MHTYLHIRILMVKLRPFLQRMQHYQNNHNASMSSKGCSMNVWDV